MMSVPMHTTYSKCKHLISPAPQNGLWSHCFKQQHCVTIGQIGRRSDGMSCDLPCHRGHFLGSPNSFIKVHLRLHAIEYSNLSQMLIAATKEDIEQLASRWGLHLQYSSYILNIPVDERNIYRLTLRRSISFTTNVQSALKFRTTDVVVAQDNWDHSCQALSHILMLLLILSIEKLNILWLATNKDINQNIFIVVWNFLKSVRG